MRRLAPLFMLVVAAAACGGPSPHVNAKQVEQSARAVGFTNAHVVARLFSSRVTVITQSPTLLVTVFRSAEGAKRRFANDQPFLRHPIRYLKSQHIRYDGNPRDVREARVCNVVVTVSATNHTISTRYANLLDRLRDEC